MSRSNYSDDFDEFDGNYIWLYRNTVANAINGKGGQKFLRELLEALDAMPVKKLVANELVTPTGECCAIGAVALKRGTDTEDLDIYDPDCVAQAFGIASCLVAEIEYMNDEASYHHETDEERWVRMRAWVVKQLKEVP